MAHPRIVAQRQAIAFERLIAAAHKLAKRHNLTEQSKALASITAKDPNFAQMLQTEALADFLEGLDGGATTPPVTIETVKEEPLKTTETVQIVDSGAKTIIDASVDDNAGASQPNPKKGVRHEK